MPEEGEDAGKVQTIGARFAHGKISLEEAAASWGAGLAPRRAADASSLAPPPLRKWSARPWG